MEIINIHRSIEAKNILSINPNTWNKITVDTKLITENMDNGSTYRVISLNVGSVLIRIDSIKIPKLPPIKAVIAITSWIAPCIVAGGVRSVGKNARIKLPIDHTPPITLTLLCIEIFPS